jgi:glucosyl-dolichyl phosphate glucuronosyltransferase
MQITVILCTYNRCQSLAEALQSLAVQKMPDGIEWEVLVVDNNSTDRTRESVESACTRHLGKFRYLFEPQQGKSHALNSGIREAHGNVLAFVDDDVTVETCWLANLTRPLRDGEWAGSGGRVVLNWTAEPPRWMLLKGPHAMHGVLAAYDRGAEAGACTGADDVPLGTNMAFQKAMFEKYGGFRTDLGPTTGSQIRSEDTEFGRRLISAGERICYEPSAVVYHPVPDERVRKEYFLAWWFDNGRAMVREYGIPAEARCYRGVPRYFIRSIATRALQWIFSVRPEVRFLHKSRVWQKAGEIVESHRQSAQARRQADGGKRFQAA